MLENAMMLFIHAYWWTKQIVRSDKIVNLVYRRLVRYNEMTLQRLTPTLHVVLWFCLCELQTSDDEAFLLWCDAFIIVYAYLLTFCNSMISLKELLQFDGWKCSNINYECLKMEHLLWMYNMYILCSYL